MSERAKTGDKKQAILAAAYEVFDARGYAAATVDQIAAKAGVAKGSVYNYFQSKQDVFWEVFAAQLASDEAEVDRIVAAPIAAVAKIEKYMEMWFATQPSCSRGHGAAFAGDIATIQIWDRELERGEIERLASGMDV